MAKVITEKLMFCQDCMIAAVNDDYTGLDYHYDKEEADEREKAIRAGLANLGGYAVMGHEHDEFSRRPCDCCGMQLHGERWEFNVIEGD